MQDRGYGRGHCSKRKIGCEPNQIFAAGNVGDVRSNRLECSYRLRGATLIYDCGRFQLLRLNMGVEFLAGNGRVIGAWFDRLAIGFEVVS